MEKKISVVIGSNYGDCGKGLIVDYLASLSSSVVVRHSSGAQAGHTVVTPDGRRHVFHHFGSGSFSETPVTFLSRFFICNPMFFVREWKELKKLGVEPKIYVDPECVVTTPWDLMINQAAEKSRGNARHGSCGAGIFETIYRSRDDDFKLTVGNFYEWVTDLLARLNAIKNDYVPRRLDQLKISEPLPYHHDMNVMRRFVADCVDMFGLVTICKWDDFYREHATKNFIFEGAQGLALDKDGADFPYVTPSKTGITNVLSLLKEIDFDGVLEPYYVTRSYLTRHGAGPLPNELDRLPYKKVVDETNFTNEYQGKLRFAYLDLDHLTGRILDDLRFSPKNFEVKPRVALTCTDQVDEIGLSFHQSVGVGFGIKDVLNTSTPCDFLRSVLHSIDAREGLISYGQTRNKIERMVVAS